MARVDPGQLARGLPSGCRVVLIWGDDAGHVREHAERLLRETTGGEPLRLVEVGKEAIRDVGLLAAEAATGSLLGGSRTVRVRDATDALAPAALAAAEGVGPGVVLLEAGALAPRSKLRVALEAHRRAAVVECRPETGAKLRASVEAMLAGQGVAAEPDVVDWLAEMSSDDRHGLCRECEKLVLYAVPGQRLTMADALACAATERSGSVDEAVLAALTGDLASLGPAAEAAIADGTAVALVRGALMHGQRLLGGVETLTGGGTEAAAGRALRPAYGAHMPELAKGLRLWDERRLTVVLDGLLRTERHCKSTQFPGDAISKQALSLAAWSTVSRR